MMKTTIICKAVLESERLATVDSAHDAFQHFSDLAAPLANDHRIIWSCGSIWHSEDRISIGQAANGRTLKNKVAMSPSLVKRQAHLFSLPHQIQHTVDVIR